MKAILILIVTVGSQGNFDRVDSCADRLVDSNKELAVPETPGKDSRDAAGQIEPKGGTVDFALGDVDDRRLNEERLGQLRLALALRLVAHRLLLSLQRRVLLAALADAQAALAREFLTELDASTD